MAVKEDKEQRPFIAEIKEKIRLLNSIAAFIVITLLAVILRYLFKPLSDVLDFLPDISITLIIIIVVILTIIGFYMWMVVSHRIIARIEKYRNRLDQIFAVTKDLREEIYGDILLNKIMEHSLSITQSDAGAIFLVENDTLVFKIVKGEKSDELKGRTVLKGKGIAGWVAVNNQPLLIADVKSDERFDPDVDLVTGDETKSILCVPMTTIAGVEGVIELNKKDDHYSVRDVELITYLADQAAASLVQARFREDQKNYEIHITDMLLDAMDFQIPDKKGHSRRVAKYGNILAKAINMPEEKRKRLYLGALLHDVGFLRIKTEDVFTREDFMKHPVIGDAMIRPINFYADVAPFILYHHERYDGYGYPEKLKGDAIPIESRIIAVADAFDSMVSETSYKVPLSFNAAIEELQRNAGTQFDFWLVDVFVSNIQPEHLQ
jgi:HD-GYP domain-containing protein (c-di-GMP phosphodiesterase class II)